MWVKETCKGREGIMILFWTHMITGVISFQWKQWIRWNISIENKTWETGSSSQDALQHVLVNWIQNKKRDNNTTWPDMHERIEILSMKSLSIMVSYHPWQQAQVVAQQTRTGITLSLIYSPSNTNSQVPVPVFYSMNFMNLYLMKNKEGNHNKTWEPRNDNEYSLSHK